MSDLIPQLNKISEQLRDYDARKDDVVVQIAGVNFHPGRQVSFATTGGNMLVNPEPRAWEQMLRRFTDQRGVRFDSDFLLRPDVVPDEAFTNIMQSNVGQFRGQRKLADWLFRLEDDSVRAVMTTRYGHQLSNSFLFNAAIECWQNGKWAPRDINIKNQHLDRDTMMLDLEIQSRDVNIPGGGSEHWSIGVRLFNDEVGRGRIGVLPWTKRGPCDNTKVIDNESALQSAHLAAHVRMIKMGVAESLHKAFFTTTEYLDSVERQLFEEIPDFANALDKLCSRNGWDNNVLFAMAKGSEGRTDRFGFSNALSAAGTHAGLPWYDSMKLQIAASRILVDSGEMSRLLRTNTITSKVVAEED